MDSESSTAARRVPWIVVGLGALIILAIIGVYLATRPSDQVNVLVSGGQATSTPVAVAVTVVVTATPMPATPTPLSAPPTSPPQPTPVPTAAAPKPTAPAVVVTAAVPTVIVVPPGVVPPGGPSQPAQVQQPPAQPTTVQPTPASGGAPANAPAVTGPVAPSGGLGNMRSEFDASIGPPTGETPTRLVVYRRGEREVRVGFAPDPQRAVLVVEVQPGSNVLTLDAARAEARNRLFPRESGPRTTQPEGNDTFVVERLTSPLLARALPAELFQQARGQPGDFLAVYLRSAPGGITRIAVGIGDDVNAIVARAGG